MHVVQTLVAQKRSYVKRIKEMELRGVGMLRKKSRYVHFSPLAMT